MEQILEFTCQLVGQMARDLGAGGMGSICAKGVWMVVRVDGILFTAADTNIDRCSFVF